MKVSVVTINYNNLEGLKRTVPSVLSQSSNDFEYVVIDGGSTDGSREYLDKHADKFAHYVSERDNGVYHAMNKGVAASRGEYVIMLNSGDIFFNAEVLEKIIGELDGTDYVCGQIINYYLDGKVILMNPMESVSLKKLVCDYLPHQSLFVRREVLLREPFDESLKIASDWAQYFLAFARGGVTYKVFYNPVSIFYMDGISCQNPQSGFAERKIVIERCVRENLLTPDFLKLSFTNMTHKMDAKRTRKINEALLINNPIKCDLHLLKWGFKLLLKDIKLRFLRKNNE